jgi:PKD domain/Secretion system C-terminal sorting domain
MVFKKQLTSNLNFLIMNYKPISNRTKQFDFKVSQWLLCFLLFCSAQFILAQTSSGIALNWNTQTGCQLFGEIRDREKDPILIDDIIDGQCITECNGSYVTYTLSGSLAAIPATTWTATGGTITGQTNTTCTVQWSNVGNGTLTFTTTSLTGPVTKTICIDKVESPRALFTITPFDPGQLPVACSLQTIYFTNLSTTNGGSGLYSYYWDFGDGNNNSANSTSTAFSPTHIYLADGVYGIKLTVVNSCGCSSTFKTEIKIGKIGFDISCASTVCDGQTTKYSIPVNGVDVCLNNYNWNVIGGSFENNNDGTVNVTWNHVDENGFGYVTFNPSNCNLNCTEPTTIRIPVIQSRGTIIGNATTCLNAQERYVLPQWPATEFTWSIVGNSGGNLAHVFDTDQRNEVIVQPLVPGVLTLRCAYQNTLLHCGGVAEFTINVSNSLQINGPSALCQGSTGSYNIPSGENSTWVLRNNFGTTLNVLANSNTYNYNFIAAGTYTLTIAGALSCPSTVITIVVSAVLAPSGITGATVICPGAPYTYTIPGSNPNAVYNWQATDGTFIGGTTGNSVVIQFGIAANHTISVYNQTTGTILCNSNTITYAVNKQTIDTEIYSLPSNAPTVCANSYVTYNAVNLGFTTLYAAGDTYTWSISNPALGSITAGQGTNSITVLWNNVSSNTNTTLQLIVQKCTITSPTAPAAGAITKAITIIPIPTVTLTSPNSTICSGTGVNFTVAAAAGFTLNPGSVVTWTVNGVPSTNTGTTISAVFSNVSGIANIQYVTATIINPNGCGGTTNTASLGITVNPEPTATSSIQGVGYNAFCTAAQINAIIVSSTITGATIQWYKAPSALVGQTGTTLNTASFGFGTYYFIATKAGCTSQSNNIIITQFCGGPATCNITQAAPVNNAYNGCAVAPPVNTGCTSCNVITLTATVAGTPLATQWIVNGPVNYNGTGLTGTIPNAVVGIYNTFFMATYNCSGSTTTSGILTTPKTITIPYLADFDYAITCAGNSTFTLGVTNKTPFIANVTSPTYKYCYKAPGSTTFTTPVAVAGGTMASLATLTLAGTYQLKLIVQGTYGGTFRQACEKTISFTIAPVPAQTITILTLQPTPCHDTAVKFGLTAALTPGDSYLWTFDNGATNTLASPSRVFNTPGTYSVGLTITNKYGCSRIIPAVSVTIPPKCFNGTVASLPNPATVCVGSSIELKYVPAVGECAVKTTGGYTWMEGNTTLTTTNANSYTVTAPGFYWVKVASANNCAYGTANRITPIFKPLPTLVLAPIPTYCRTADIPLSITTNATTISWTIDNVPYANFNNLTNVVIPAAWGFAAGSHSIAVTVTGTNGCSSTATGTLVIASTPPPPTIVMTLVSCKPYRVKLDATGSFGYYNWSNGTTGSSTTVNSGGPYMVTVSSGGCTSNNQIDVPKTMEEFTWVFPSGCYTACPNNLGTLIGPSVMDPGTSWEWQFNQATINHGHGTVPSLPINLNGVYNLALVNSLNCATVSNDLNYRITECPKCDIVASIKELVLLDTPFCSTSGILNIINISGNQLPVTISCPSNEVLVTPSSLTVPAGTTNYPLTLTPINGFTGGPVTLVLTGFDVKSNRTCETTIVIDLPSCIATGKMNPTKNKITSSNDLVIAPNPSKGSTAISFTYSTAPQLVIYDVFGKQITQYTANEAKGTWQLDTIGIAAGVYIVVMKDASGILMQKKLVIE